MMVERYYQGVRWMQPTKRPYEIPTNPPLLFTVAHLHETHICVRELDAASPDAIYHYMQTDRWPRRTAAAFNAKIFAQGLTHSSMCPGDVIEDVAAGRFYECDLRGWRELDRDIVINAK